MKTTTTTTNQNTAGNQGPATGIPPTNAGSSSTQGTTGGALAASPSFAGSGSSPSLSSSQGGSPGTQATPSMSMWSLSLGKSNFPKEGLRLLANLKPFGTIGVPYILDMSLNLPSGNLSLIAAQITNAGLQHAVIVPINKTAEGAAGESLYQAELGHTITGINPFTRQPDTISGGSATDLMLLNNGTSDIAFNDDNGATMTLAYR